jgi:hypothetical protein
LKISAIQTEDDLIRDALIAQHMDHFDAWWQLAIAWLEPPNLERGGWSGVGRWQLRCADNSTVEIYVKRQQNHTRLSVWHPWRGLPTFMVEYDMLKYLRMQGVRVPDVVYAGVRDVQVGRQAILATQALQGYVELTPYCTADKMAAEPDLLTAVAKALQTLHAAGIQHRALYPKHLFVRRVGDAYEIAFIDLETAKHMWLPAWQRLRDLRQFMSRLQDWPDSLLYQLYAAYMGGQGKLYHRCGWWWLRWGLNRLNKR